MPPLQLLLVLLPKSLVGVDGHRETVRSTDTQCYRLSKLPTNKQMQSQGLSQRADDGSAAAGLRLILRLLSSGGGGRWC